MRKGGLIWTFLIGSICVQMATAQTFTCDNSFYLTQIPENQETSALYKVYREEESGEWVKEELFADLSYTLGSIGYRVQDKLLYGITYPDVKLVRINSLGEVTELADLVSRGMDTARWDFKAGDVVPGGHVYYLIGHNKETRLAEIVTTVQLRPNYRVGAVAFVSIEPMRIEDLAYDPIYGTINAYDIGSRKLVRLTQSGSATTYFSAESQGVGALGGVFFDKSGSLWGLGRSSPNESEDTKLVRFNKFNGEVLETASLPGGAMTAACSCPYTIDYHKYLDTDTTSGCETLTLTYAIANKMGTGQGDIVFRDTLPLGFEVERLVKQPFLTSFSFEEETGALELVFRELVLGNDSLILEIKSSPEGFESWNTRSSLGPFPEGIGQVQLSDNPKTELPGDPTLLSYTPLSLDLPELAFICQGQTLSLTATVLPTSAEPTYTWRTGDSTQTIEVTQAGFYKLSITNGCEVLTDSVQVSGTLFPLTVDLGSDASLREGQEIRLFPLTNSNVSYTVSWEVEEGIELDCDDCPNPVATVSQSANVVVTLTDANGCIATDTLFIEAGKIRDVWMPNVFSPNGDGINDILYLQGRALADFRNFRIVDRWGQQVFQRDQGRIDQAIEGWDGKKGGNTVQSGVYYWSVEIIYPDGSTEARQGFVTLVQ